MKELFEGMVIDPDVHIGERAVIREGTRLKGNTVIGRDCVIADSVITDSEIGDRVKVGPFSVITNCVIGNDVTIVQSNVSDSTVGEGSNIGPFAVLRNNAEIGNNCRIGGFVEVKNSVLEEGVKAAHLAYIGDAVAGRGTNIGCGTVFANYDGRKKSKTKVGNNVFIGANVNLVAPVEIGDNAYIAAGSTVTEDVPANALAIARERQVNKPDYFRKKIP